VLRVLGERATPAAVAELTKLVGEFPDQLSVAATVIVARRGAHANAWAPPSPEEVADLLSNATRRLVRSSTELAALLLETLTAVEMDLPPHGELLWDRQGARRRRTTSSSDTTDSGASTRAGNTETWRPKPEAALSAYLAYELTLRLTGLGMAVNREVLVLPTDAYGAGDRTDITVEATLTHDPYSATPAASARRVAVVIEVKGSWNPDLLTAQRAQLAMRYLPEANTDTGIYLVGWYPIELWTAPRDSRQTIARRHEPGRLRQTLHEQANSIADELGVHTYRVLLNIPRPHRANQATTTAVAAT
jgi:hypothetical protein